MFKRSLGDLDSDRRSSTITRRSFFRRKSSNHTSRELASFSDFSINSYGGGDGLQHTGMQLKDEALNSTYQRVERLDCKFFPFEMEQCRSEIICDCRYALWDSPCSCVGSSE